ncbi:glycerophosphodiester phosphodiesterase [Peptoniphilaceae bacterium SGI.137]
MTQILAHRGLSARFPENTMLAFKEAGKLDVAGFETDVQMTRDGVLVITHDEEISRTSNGRGYIKDFTLKELKTLDFRNGMNQYELNEDTRIPTLEEFFEWFQNTDKIINLELKSSMIRYEGMVEKTMDMIQKFDLVNRVIISSFNHRDVVKAKKLIPEIQCGFLTWSVILNPGKYTRAYGIDYYHPDFHAMDDEDFEDCRKEGIAVNPYTVDEKKDIERMLEKKVLYLITNVADFALEMLGDRNEKRHL